MGRCQFDQGAAEAEAHCEERPPQALDAALLRSFCVCCRRRTCRLRLGHCWSPAWPARGCSPALTCSHVSVSPMKMYVQAACVFINSNSSSLPLGTCWLWRRLSGS